MNGMKEVRPGVWVAEEPSVCVRVGDIAPSRPEPLLMLAQEEAEELYRYTRYDYINPNTYPALHRLVCRLSVRFAPRA